MKDRSYRRKTWLLIGITVVLALVLVLLVVLAIFGRGGKKVDTSRQEDLRDVISAMADSDEPESEPEESADVTEEVPDWEDGQAAEEPSEEPSEDQPENELDTQPATESTTNLSVWEGYWYLFNAENVYCTEYQFHEDGSYEKRERYTATGKYKNHAEVGGFECVYSSTGSMWLRLDDGSDYCNDEDFDQLWTYVTNSWGTESCIVMVHYADVPEVSQLPEGYDVFMLWSEEDVYEYDGVADEYSCVMYAYPGVFREMAEGDTYADGTAMEPLNILLSQVNSYWGYRSKDGTQALFYHLWNIHEYESEEIVQLIEQEYNLGKGNYMVEWESYWDVEGFRLLLNINDRWHFIRAVICEGTSEMAVMEYTFTGESYWPYNPTIAHLEYNLQFFEVTD